MEYYANLKFDKSIIKRIQINEDQTIVKLNVTSYIPPEKRFLPNLEISMYKLVFEIERVYLASPRKIEYIFDFVGVE